MRFLLLVVRRGEVHEDAVELARRENRGEVGVVGPYEHGVGHAFRERELGTAHHADALDIEADEERVGAQARAGYGVLAFAAAEVEHDALVGRAGRG